MAKIANSNLTEKEILALGWEKAYHPEVFTMVGVTNSVGMRECTWTLSVNWRSNINCDSNGEPANFCGYIPDAECLFHIMRGLGLTSKKVENKFYLGLLFES